VKKLEQSMSTHFLGYQGSAGILPALSGILPDRIRSTFTRTLSCALDYKFPASTCRQDADRNGLETRAPQSILK
jgi:hypothetical protein